MEGGGPFGHPEPKRPDQEKLEDPGPFWHHCPDAPEQYACRESRAHGMDSGAGVDTPTHQTTRAGENRTIPILAFRGLAKAKTGNATSLDAKWRQI